jgi:hypothetical protein
VIAALGIIIAGVWQHAETTERQEDREAKAAAYKGRSSASLHIDGVRADVVATWSRDRDRVIVELHAPFEVNSQYLHVEAAGQSASSVRENGWFPEAPEIALPVDDPLDDVTVRVAVGGKRWSEGDEGIFRTVRLSPTGTAYDAEGKKLPN